MSRIPYPEDSTLSAEKLEVAYGSGRPGLNVTRMAMHAPDSLWRAHNAFKVAMVYGTTMDQRLREVLILRVAYLSNSEYEIHHHLSISANLGFTPETQAAVRDGRYEELSSEERIVAEFTDEVVLNVSPSDTTLAAARAAFGDALIVEMLILIGSYMATARMAAATGVELDKEAVRGWNAPAQERGKATA